MFQKPLPQGRQDPCVLPGRRTTLLRGLLGDPYPEAKIPALDVKLCFLPDPEPISFTEAACGNLRKRGGASAPGSSVL